MPVPMQLTRIIISEISDQQVIFLKEVNGSRQFPILIGHYEAGSIDLRIRKETKQTRPLTHDLIVSVGKALGAEFDSVLISELREHTFFAKLRLRRQGEIIEVDCRPSDAIAVAVTFDPVLPIFVAEEVLDEARGA